MSEPNKPLDFKKIDFGKADALNEKNLLINGFLDAEGYLEKIINGDKFFVIGQKGSGKSAIASKLCIISETEHTIAASVQMLDEFDFDGFAGVIPGSNTPEARYGDTWEFLLGLKLIEKYAESEYTVSDSKADPKHLVSALKKLGVLPNSLKAIIKTFKTKSFKISGKVLEYSSSDRKMENKDIKKLIGSVVHYLYDIKPDLKHFLVLDGLDSILGKRENQYAILSSLIRAANYMNRRFRDSGIRSKVVVLCRKDVLDKLNDPNRSKYIQDSGVELNWYQTGNNVKETNLYKLINLRARNSLNQDVDVMGAFFPFELYDRETFRYLLDNTRYTPRDVIQLMNKIQETSRSEGATETSIRDGLNSYSDGYFLMEIKDSLVGMLSNDEIEEAFRVLSSIGKLTFTVQEFRDDLSKDYNEMQILNALYAAGAISNVDQDDKGNRYRVSKIRNPNSSFNEKKMISINMGLKKALMLH